jgi:hypothetical protein
LLKERRAELASPRFTMAQLLEENQLTKLSIMTTVFRWMGRLGFKYETRHTMSTDMKNPKQRNTERQQW